MEYHDNLPKQSKRATNCHVTGKGSHGDGKLSSAGHAKQPDWPGYHSVNLVVTGAAGSGRRGGDWYLSVVHATVSGRIYAAITDNTPRFNRNGLRMVRTAPLPVAP